MNRNVLFLRVGLMLVVAVWIGTTSPHELLPDAISATQFRVNTDQMSQSGGCLEQLSFPCPEWEDPGNSNGICECTGPNDESCQPEEAEGDDEDGAAIFNAGYPLFPYRGFGYGSSYELSTRCTTFYTCQPGCLPSLEILDAFSCDLEEVSAFEANGSAVNVDDRVWCDTDVALRTHESRMQEQLAMVSGIGLHFFSAE